MNVGTYNELPQENIDSTWLLPCPCGTQRCHWNARLKPDMLCTLGHPYNNPPPKIPTPKITILILKVTYCNDMFIAETNERKIMKYQPLISNVMARGWNTTPLIVLELGDRATIHIPPMKELDTKLKLPTSQTWSTCNQMNLIAIQYAHLILVHKNG